MFEPLSDFVLGLLGIMKPRPPSRAVVEFDKDGHVVDSRPHHKTPLSIPMKRIDRIFAASLFRFHDSGHVSISVPHVRGSMSMTLSQPNKRHRLLTNLARLSLPTTSGNKEDVLKITDAEASMYFSEKTMEQWRCSVMRYALLVM